MRPIWVGPRIKSAECKREQNIGAVDHPIRGSVAPNETKSL